MSRQPISSVPIAAGISRVPEPDSCIESTMSISSISLRSLARSSRIRASSLTRPAGPSVIPAAQMAVSPWSIESCRAETDWLKMPNAPVSSESQAPGNVSSPSRLVTTYCRAAWPTLSVPVDAADSLLEAVG